MGRNWETIDFTLVFEEFFIVSLH